MSPAPRWGYTGLGLGAGVALGIFVLHQVGWLAAWDGFFYDHCLAWTARWREPEPKVLLLRLAPDETWSETEALQAMERLDGLGARVIALNSVPMPASRQFFEHTSKLKKVVFGRELRPNRNDPDELELESWPEAARDLDLPLGAVYLPPSVKGVHRRHQTHVQVGTNTIPTLEGRASELAGATSDPPPVTGTFLVNFLGGPATIPNAPLARALAGDLIADLVKGKVVLIGGESLIGLETPVSGGAEPMSFLEFQGNAVQTLLERSPIQPLGWPWLLLLLVGLGAGSALLYQRASSVAGVRLVLGILAACVLAGVGAMGLFRLWIPLGSLVLAQTGQFALLLVFKTRMTNLALNEMRLRALNQIRERFCPQDVAMSTEYWEHVGAMIDQALGVRRMLFLERVPQSRRLVEVKAFNCRFEELQEQDRTLDAAVFSMALVKGAPVQVANLLRCGTEPEEQFLCPLVFAGEVLGLWIVGLEPEKASEIPQLDKVLARFGEQIARLAYNKKRAAADRSLAARLKGWFAAEKEDQTCRELSGTADLLEQHYGVLEAALNQIGTAMIVYDFFGHALKANEPALTLLRPENFVPTRASALEFLRLVTGRDDGQVRRLLRHVLLEGLPTSVSVRLPSQGERQFLLRLCPLAERKPGHPGLDHRNVRGVVCELVETTSLSTLASIKGVVADRLGVELRDHLAAIEMSAALLESDSYSPQERQTALDAIHAKTRVCVQVLHECQKYLGRDVDAHTIQCFPLDALELLGQVCNDLSHKAAARRVSFDVQQPRLMTQVLASTTELGRLFGTILGLLIKDAAENTVLSIEIEDVSTVARFRFANCGFGIPNERLQEALSSTESPASEEFQVLREASIWVRDWGGSLEVGSEVGKGYCIILALRQFQMVSFPPQLPA